MFYLGGASKTVAQGKQLSEEIIASGRAFDRFRQMVEMQGGDISTIDDPTRLPSTNHRVEVLSLQAGYVAAIACEQVGTACVILGGGRERKEDSIDPAVGIVVHKKIGDEVSAGEALCTIYCHSDAQGARARTLLLESYQIAERSARAQNSVDSSCDSKRRLGDKTMGRFTGILGLLTMLGLAYAFSTNRRAINRKTVAWGLGLQVVFAIFVLKIEIGRVLFQKAGDGVNWLLRFAFVGSKFVFGELGAQGSSMGFVFAFQVLPTVIFIAAFFAVLYHYGIMQLIIKLAAKVMTRFMGASGAESLNVAASIFMGQTEAPLTIRPFLPDLTRSELMTVMTSGMAHVSGGIMAAYIAFGIEPKHLLERRHHDCPGNDPDVENAGAGDGNSEDRGPRGDERGRRRCGEEGKSAGRDCARHNRRFGTCAEHCGDADFISGADCPGQWHHGWDSQSPGDGLVSLQPAADLSGHCLRRSRG